MAHKRGRPTESRLERVQEIIADDPKAREHFENMYQNCGVPRWLREAISTFIEQQSWCNVDSAQGLFAEFIAEAFFAVLDPDHEKSLSIHSSTVKDLKSRYQEHPETFIQNMRSCVEMEVNIISAKTVVRVEEYAAEPSSSAEIATRAYHDMTVKDIVGNDSKKQRMQPTESNLMLHERMQEVSEMFRKEVDACFERRKQWQREDDSIHYRDQKDLKQNSLDEVIQIFCGTDENFKKIKDVYDNIKEIFAHLCTGKLDEAFQNINSLHVELVARSFVLVGLTKRIFSMEKKKKADTFQFRIKSLLGLGIRKITSIGLYSKANQRIAEVKYRKFDDTQALLDGVSVVDFTRMKSQNCASEPCFLKIDVQDSQMKDFQVKSGPCLCASHTQVSKATGLLMWMLAFPSNEGCYHREVDWKEFLSVLCCFWTRETKGCTLLEENKECLADYFGNPDGIDTFKITLVNVFEEKVPSQEKDKKKLFTMWEWFNGCINLVREYPELFQKRLIHGLVTKERARKMLDSSEKKDGAFLIRISQTFLDRRTKPYAGLSIVVQHWNKKERKYTLIHGEMFSINHPGNEQGVLPKEMAFGRWLMSFAADSSIGENSKKVYLSHLCGRTEPVGETFGKYTYRDTTRSKTSDYTTFGHARFFDCRKPDQAICDVPPGRYEQLLELLPQLHDCCEISPPQQPYCIILQSPNSQSPKWAVWPLPQGDIDSSTTQKGPAQPILAVDGIHCDENSVQPEETTECSESRMESDMPFDLSPSQNGYTNGIGTSGLGRCTESSSNDSSDLSLEEIVTVLEDPDFKVTGSKAPTKLDCTQLPRHSADTLGDSASNIRPGSCTSADTPQSSPFTNSALDISPQSVQNYRNKQSSKSNGQVVPSISPWSDQSSPAESISSQRANHSSFFKDFSPNGVVHPNDAVSPSMNALPQSVESMNLDMD
ncbi:uncharacterized protein LOC135496332 [Lineus longissimus]|uniref:uncharacterized protein LOC135496332 n=1 Tax=Lineus longissimus TaxID=88925 RepID=UPI00315DB9EF